MNIEGIPIRFQAHIREEGYTGDVTSIDWRGGIVHILNKKGYPVAYGFDEVIFLQRIGATDNSDPKQELYLGDCVRIELQRNNITAVLVWHDLSVCLKFREEGKTLRYHLGDFYKSRVGKIIKLYSIHTPKGEEIAEKVGLLEDKDAIK